ncbi:hypothetical protein [Spirochaeta africana]|uniref:Pyridoxamine 5'-phosphate oxidase putative domain-containing protein n=1 Tax=Spirochaeta africana (strain ATCC 700263 / DSM 8902 / Z-7692) TaxID=889378 RepID=H9UIQ9_SPIAZ|nr:hypothetical protein [Spirochaeta africana]AFG37402.1 hypothetical protein Spiaf_1328 [Spirochaeta africana DSM 8902]
MSYSSFSNPLVLLAAAVLISGATFTACSPTEDYDPSHTDTREQEADYQQESRLDSRAADAVAAASRVHYFEANTMYGQQLAEALRDSIQAIPVATADPQGVPTISMMTPVMIGQDVVMLAIAETQTRQNILDTGLATAAAYLYQPAETPSQQYRGARVVLGLIDDEQELQSLTDGLGDVPENALFLRILRIIPLG